MRVLATAAAGLCLLAASASVTALPPDLALTPYSVGTLTYPIAVRAPRDGSGRLFVPQQGGAVRVLDRSGSVLAANYLSVAVSVPSPDSGEQGLLGMAFDPNFGRDPGQPGYADFYLAFTAPGSDPKLGALPDQVVRRYTVADPAANVASVVSSVDVIRIPDLYSNHNGGDIHFGGDGYLYYGMGDGGSGGDPNGFAQTTGRKTVSGKSYYLLGKMLRLDVRNATASATADMCGATPGQPAQYSIPAGNPFKGSASDCGEIFLYGLRNPFRFSFDRANGDLWIGDVGQGAYEEVDYRPVADSAINYGWNLCEGTHTYPGGATGCPASTSTAAPVLEYNHSGGRCAITGGFRFRGPIQQFQGAYTYADSCSSSVFIATLGASSWSGSVFTTLSAGYGTVVSFGEDEQGNLYAVHESEGKIYRFTSDYIFEDGLE